MIQLPLQFGPGQGSQVHHPLVSGTRGCLYDLGHLQILHGLRMGIGEWVLASITFNTKYKNGEIISPGQGLMKLASINFMEWRNFGPVPVGGLTGRAHTSE